MRFLTLHICTSLPTLEPQKSLKGMRQGGHLSHSGQSRMKKKVMRRDPLGRDGHFLLEISPTESRGEECRALRDAPWEQSSAGWETGLSG